MPFGRSASILSCIPALLIAGCADLTTYNHARTLDYKAPREAFIDAKQRAIFASPEITRDSAGNVRSVVRFCSEPSPDALSAIAGGASGSLSVKDQAQAAAAFTLAESAASIGLRTQSIQLMRDSMYRLCEQTASGALSPIQFETLFRHFQNSMVAILAIEQLTGAVRPAEASLSSTAARGSAKDIATLTDGAAKAQTASADADKDAAAKADALTAAQAKAAAYLKSANVSDESGLADDKKADYAPLKQAVLDATAAKATADASAATAKQTWAVYQTGLNAIGGGDLSASGSTTLTGGSGSSISDASAPTIASAVLSIVDRELDSGFFRETCATLFNQVISQAQTAAPASGSLQANCDAYAAATVADVTAHTALVNAIVANIERQTQDGKTIDPAKIGPVIAAVAPGGGVMAAAALPSEEMAARVQLTPEALAKIFGSNGAQKAPARAHGTARKKPRKK